MIIPELIVSGAELDEKYDRKKGMKRMKTEEHVTKWSRILVYVVRNTCVYVVTYVVTDRETKKHEQLPKYMLLLIPSHVLIWHLTHSGHSHSWLTHSRLLEGILKYKLFLKF